MRAELVPVAVSAVEEDEIRNPESSCVQLIAVFAVTANDAVIPLSPATGWATETVAPKELQGMKVMTIAVPEGSLFVFNLSLLRSRNGVIVIETAALTEVLPGRPKMMSPDSEDATPVVNDVPVDGELVMVVIAWPETEVLTVTPSGFVMT
jgi:hypothetical protein